MDDATQKLVDEALDRLDRMNAEGLIAYDDYSTLHDLVGSIGAGEFDGDVSTEALAAWERYDQMPLNPVNLTAEQREQDAFTAGYEAAQRPPVSPEVDRLRAQVEAAREAWWSGTEQGDTGLVYTDRIEDAMDAIWDAIGHAEWTPRQRPPVSPGDVTVENSPTLAAQVEAKKWGYNLSSTEAAHIAEAVLAASGLRETVVQEREANGTLLLALHERPPVSPEVLAGEVGYPMSPDDVGEAKSDEYAEGRASGYNDAFDNVMTALARFSLPRSRPRPGRSKR